MKLSSLVIGIILAVSCSTAYASPGSSGQSSSSGNSNMLNGADLAVVDAYVTLDALIGSSDLISDDIGVGTCSMPTKNAGCLSCANKGDCKQCCANFTGKQRAGCDKGCDSKFPK